MRTNKGNKMDQNTKIEAAARASHEVNRAYCLALGDDSHACWDDAPDWQKTSARNGVLGVLAGNTPKESHETWLREKEETGWVWGPIKDPKKKEHPCCVPYEELPEFQKEKDHIYVTVVKAMLKALDKMEKEGM